MEFKGTPGPWGIILGNAGPIIFSGNRGNVVAYTHKKITDKERMANAHLIAAAPDMINALYRVARLNENCGEIGEGMLRTIIEESRAAIAKALGENNV